MAYDGDEDGDGGDGGHDGDGDNDDCGVDATTGDDNDGGEDDNHDGYCHFLKVYLSLCPMLAASSPPLHVVKFDNNPIGPWVFPRI